MENADDSPLSDIESDAEVPETVGNASTRSSSLPSLASSRSSSRAPVASGPRTRTRAIKPVARSPVQLTKNAADAKAKGKAKASVDPLELLLREKKTADKRGNGQNAFKLAEIHVMKADDLLSDDNDESNVHRSRATTQDWTNEEAAMRAIEVAKEKAERDGEEVVVDEGITLGEEDRERLLGKKGGEAIGKILDGDREVQASGQSGKPEKTPGVPLWHFDLRGKGKGRADDMDVDVSIPSLQLSASPHPLLSLFSNTLNSLGKYLYSTFAQRWFSCSLLPDFQSASLLLNSGMIASLGAGQEDLVRYLLAHGKSFYIVSGTCRSSNLQRSLPTTPSSALPLSTHSTTSGAPTSLRTSLSKTSFVLWWSWEPLLKRWNQLAGLATCKPVTSTRVGGMSFPIV